MAIWLAGCAPSLINVSKRVPNHVLMVDEVGSFVSLKEISSSEPCESEKEKDCALYEFLPLSKDGDLGHVKRLIDEIAQPNAASWADCPQQMPRGKERKLLIFVHGGLNERTDAMKRAKELRSEILCAGYYPIFVIWNTFLLSSYSDHLLYVRQGEDWRVGGPWKQFGGMIFAPFYLLADVGRALLEAPFTWSSELANSDVEPFKKPTDLVKEAKSAKLAIEPWFDHMKPPVDYRAHFYVRDGDENSHADVSQAVTFPAKLATGPLIDLMGDKSWDIMVRRADVLFHAEDKYHPSKGETLPLRNRGLSLFLDLLKEKASALGLDLDVTLVGHSMGAIVLNEMLRMYPDMPFNDVVYMAAACSVRDYNSAVFPYVAAKRASVQKTTIHHLMLHYQAERNETHYGGFVPNGSLLVWLDDFLTHPRTHLEMTLGRYENFFLTFQHTPKDLVDNIYVKVFSPGFIKEHTDFAWKFKFWLERCRNPLTEEPADCLR